jgi:CubicO group peptidase (beta-lactamase class C family)
VAYVVAGAAVPVRRDYRPTAGWRTATPAAKGMDPAVLAAIPGNVSSLYPQIRSVLVVRHGYLVYERYWQGVTATDGHDVQSVTKSFVSALVGIALGEGKIKGLDQTRRRAARPSPAQRQRPAPRPGHRRAAADDDLRAGR